MLEEGKEGERKKKREKHTDRCNGARRGRLISLNLRAALSTKKVLDRENQKHTHTETLFQKIKKKEREKE